MDLHMPDVDSADLLRALAAAGCEAEILLMSGADQATLRKVQALGASLNLRMTQILAKPLRAEGFRTALNACAASTAGG
jgi:CheY-like chemotaxis protein